MSQSVLWSPDRFRPAIALDMALSTITEASFVVSAARDLRGYGKSYTATGAAQPLREHDHAYDGRDALTMNTSSKMSVDAGSGALTTNTPFVQIELSHMLNVNGGAYITGSMLGGTQTTAGGNSVIGAIGGQDWFGGAGQTGGGGKGGWGSRFTTIDITRPRMQLKAFDGVTVRSYVNSSQVQEKDASYSLLSGEISLGGASYTGYTGASDRYVYYSYAIYGGVAWGKPQIDRFFQWVPEAFPSMLESPLLIVDGCSIDNDYLTANVTWAGIARGRAADRWTVNNYSVTGQAIGYTGSGTVLWGSGTEAAPDATTAALYTSLWDPGTQYEAVLTVTGLTTTNDLFHSIVTGGLSAEAAMEVAWDALLKHTTRIRATGSYCLVQTPLPRADVTGGSNQTTWNLAHQQLCARIRAEWNVPLAEGGLGAHFFVDLAAESRLMDPTNSTYYSSSHPTVKGKIVIGELHVASMNALVRQVRQARQALLTL